MEVCDGAKEYFGIVQGSESPTLIYFFIFYFFLFIYFFNIRDSIKAKKKKFKSLLPKMTEDQKSYPIH